MPRYLKGGPGFPSPNEECGFFRKEGKVALMGGYGLVWFPSPNEECGFFRIMGAAGMTARSMYCEVSIP